jgi:hypothetical protein
VDVGVIVSKHVLPGGARARVTTDKHARIAKCLLASSGVHVLMIISVHHGPQG